MINLSERFDAMQPLDRTMRAKLERAVREAREIAEAGAAASLQQLGVGDASVPPYLIDSERDLRKRLRAHGRQLGDRRDSRNETQEIERLIEEVAYEHWHRMLFARFLAENKLLMYPASPPVAVSLEECEELADEEGARNGWELASNFATKMLPQIFRIESPVFEVQLPPEHEQKLESIVRGLQVEIFTASDSIGWIYQFWQSKRKEEVNAAEVKIGARELPAVTQLFTEPYMVSFLLDNSIGAWWAARTLSESDLRNADDEQELRDKASIAGMPLTYLRFVRRIDGSWNVATTLNDWPADLREFKLIDPCCGSGHFLVASLLMLVPMRMQLEKVTAREAIDLVLSENLYGLEIDRRCVELAAFALALAAWRYPGSGGYRNLPRFNVACCGLSVSVSKDDWKQLALDKHNLRIALEWMYDAFKDAPTLGSLVNPSHIGSAKVVSYDELRVALERAAGEKSNEILEAAVVAQGLSRAAILLAQKYNLVVTNVPYLVRGKQSEILKKHCETHYSVGQGDLATAFLWRCLELCLDGGTVSTVLPQNWLFLNAYKRLRVELLKKRRWHLIARLGAGAFDTISGEIVKVILMVLSRDEPSPLALKTEKDLSEDTIGIDVSDVPTPQDKAALLAAMAPVMIKQQQQLDNPDSRIIFEDSTTAAASAKLPLLAEYATALSGSLSGDSLRFIRNFWEVTSFNDGEWRLHQSSPTGTSFYSGQSEAIFWENESGSLFEFAQSVKHLNHVAQNWLRGKPNWQKDGIVLGQMKDLPAAIYTGEIYDCNCCAIVPKDPSHLSALWCFCSSSEYQSLVRQVDQSLKVTNATLVKVPFDLGHWQSIAEREFPNGLPKPFSEDPTQWIFHGHPARSTHALQVATCRLLGYRWPSEVILNLDLAEEARNLAVACNEFEDLVDEDGIVCIPSVRGEPSAIDRLHNLLARAYGANWSAETLENVLKQANHSGKSLESWLREKFFFQHCELFNQKPFVWQIWDGMQDGFSCLVNYHKFDRKLLETLIYTYLGDWIAKQRHEINSSVDGAEQRLGSAEILKKRLELILEGQSPYDIFVRWKPIAKQPIGWEPDINDGIRFNIRPFLTVPDVGKKGAGVLRDRPKINWNKDRGKDTTSSPWHSVFDGDRINDHHLSIEEKMVARRSHHP
jgi:hypothetical protein